MFYDYDIDPRTGITEPYDLALTPDAIFIDGEISGELAAQIRNDIFKARANKKFTQQTVLPVIITSPGGSVYEARSIIDMLKATEMTIMTVTVGLAASMALCITSSGTKGWRYASPTSRLLVHRAKTGLEEGFKDEILMSDELGELRRINDEILNQLDQDAGQTKGFFRRALDERQGGDWYLKPSQAKKLGLIDHIGIPVCNIKVSVDISYKGSKQNHGHSKKSPGSQRLEHVQSPDSPQSGSLSE